MQTWSQWETILKKHIFEKRHTTIKRLLKQLTTALQNKHTWNNSPPFVAKKVTTVCLLGTGASVSTSVDTSAVPEQFGTSLTGLEYKNNDLF